MLGVSGKRVGSQLRVVGYGASRAMSGSASAKESEFDMLKKMYQRQEDMMMQLFHKVDRLEKLTVEKKGTGSVAKVGAGMEKEKSVPKGLNPRGFVDYHRKPEPYRPPSERSRDWLEINTPGHADPGEQKRQAARCMNCGTPFCQTHTGCPVNNPIPDFNQLVLEENWEEAIDRLHATNNFPEFTGRVCPAPCEGACVAGLIDESVTIKNHEYQIADMAWKQGWIKPKPPSVRSGLKVAIVGSGPAGLACADQLNQLGHNVTVFEREDKIGGLLYYGIPNMKLDKRTVDRRVDLLSQEGVEFQANKNIGVDVPGTALAKDYDAVVLTVGATKPRVLTCPGADLAGVYPAMDFLTANQKDLEIDGKGIIKNKWGDKLISAEGKNVVVIGGGDTGTDCIGTSIRHYCKSLVNLELLPDSPPKRDSHSNPWPLWPKIHRVDYGHAEAQYVFGHDPRKYAVNTKRLIGDANGHVKAVVTVKVKVEDGKFVEIPGSEEELPADLVLMAMGFLGPEKTLIDEFQLETDPRGNVLAEYGKYSTTRPGIFAAGDCRRGQSLVVWAIHEGREVATAVDTYLSSKSK